VHSNQRPKIPRCISIVGESGISDVLDESQASDIGADLDTNRRAKAID
jgi:hypothetical protein